MRIPSMLVASIVSACSNSHAVGADAARGDASADVASDASIFGAVNVTVHDLSGTGAPAVGVDVVFVEPDGSLASQTTTDAAGTAHGSVWSGGSVTAVLPASATSYQLETVLDVQPGDDLSLGHVHDTTPVGTFTVNLPSMPGGGPSYFVAGPCGTAGSMTPVVTLTITANCRLDKMDLVAMAFIGTYDFVGALEQRDVTFVAGGSTTIAGAWVTPPTYTVSYTNVPAQVSSVQVQRFAPDLFGLWTGSSGMPSGSALNLGFTAPPSMTAQMAASLFGPAQATQYIYQSAPGMTYQIDAGANMLPWLGTPVLDPATRKVTVPVTGSGTGDLFVLTINYARPGQTFEWLVYGPHPSDVTLPALPGALAERAPKAGDDVTSVPNVAAFHDADTVAGYGEIRSDVFDVTDRWYSGRSATLLRSSFSP